MKIKQITINNYKAFYGKHTIDVDGKNLFIYGENGSGKSSLYYALKDFFQSSDESIDLNAVKNLFIDNSENENVNIDITFNPDESDATTDSVYTLSATDNVYDNTIFRDTNSLKSFLTYKHLLEIHHIKKGHSIDLFNLLVNGVLANFKRIGMDSSFDISWDHILEVEKAKTSSTWNMIQKRKDIMSLITKFNDDFGSLFIAPTSSSPNPDYILEHAEPILKIFDQGIKIKLRYQNATYIKDKVEAGKVLLSVSYGGKDIPQPHLFFNEARLSAIAISIYLGMIKRYPQRKKYKILFLDDLFIGLDISNRMPLLKIIDTFFSDYQVFISTYDKPWYEMIRFMLEGNSKWNCIEFYPKKTSNGFDVPIYALPEELKKRDSSPSAGNHIQRYIDNAEFYYSHADYKAAGVYIRSAFEFILKRYCYGKSLPVKYRLSSSDLTTEDFWNTILKYKNDEPRKCKLTDETKNSIEIARKFVLNPLAHFDTEKYELNNEIGNSIDVVRALQQEIGM